MARDPDASDEPCKEEWKKGDFDTPNITMLIDRSLNGYQEVEAFTFDRSNDVDTRVLRMTSKVKKMADLSEKLIDNAHRNITSTSAAVGRKNLF